DSISCLETRRGTIGVGFIPELNNLLTGERLPNGWEARVVRTVGKLVTFGNDHFFPTAKVPIKSELLIRFSILRHKRPQTFWKCSPRTTQLTSGRPPESKFASNAVHLL